MLYFYRFCFSPVQVFDMYNGGAVPVAYRFDLSGLENVRSENFNQQIFSVVNPIGDVLPGQTVSIEWHFNPIEAKTYMVGTLLLS